MSLKTTYEIRDGYLYVRVSGEYNQFDERTNYFELYEKANKYALNRIVWDITSITGFDDKDASDRAIFNISKFIGESVPKHLRLAILETPQQNKNERSGEPLIIKRGAKVKITSNLDEALEWLGVKTSETPESVDTK